MKQLHIKFYFLILALLSTASAQAAWYEVEIVLFEYIEPDTDGELWYENPGLPSLENSVELVDRSNVQPSAALENGESVTGADLIPYMVLPRENYRLKSDYRILKLSKNYRPHLHLAWQQPGLEGNEVKAVHIKKIRRLVQDQPEFAMENNLIFDGTVSLRSTKYLHVDIDFAFYPESFFQTSGISKQISKPETMEEKRPENLGKKQKIFVEQQADYVRLTETRRIKLNELHYFDHPMFGVLLMVSRLEPE